MGINQEIHDDDYGIDISARKAREAALEKLADATRRIRDNNGMARDDDADDGQVALSVCEDILDALKLIVEHLV
jgi:hypothetical protein